MAASSPTDDTQGADGAAVTTGTLSGTYGSLVLSASSTYTYTPSPDDGDFEALTGAGWAAKCSPTPDGCGRRREHGDPDLTIKNDDDRGDHVTSLTPKGARAGMRRCTRRPAGDPAAE